VDGVSLTVTAVSEPGGAGPLVRGGTDPHDAHRHRAGRQGHRRAGQP
jgi:hypothetical protein